VPLADDSDEESEGEELRKAAKAYTAVSQQTKASQPDVIVLDDSSDDEQPPPRSQHAVSRAASQLASIAAACNNAGSSQRSASQADASQSSSSHGPASSSQQQGNGWVGSRQVPASLQAGTSRSNGPLRIKLPTRQPDRRLQPQQQQQQLQLPSQLMSNGDRETLHPADPASSAGRLQAAVSMRPPAPRQGPAPSNSGKRKHYELDGQYGAYSQAAAQASGMSMADHMQQAMHRGGASRLAPYPDTSVSYSSRGGSSSSQVMPSAGAQPQAINSAYGHYPTSPEYWLQQQQMGSPAYAQPSVGSPTYRQPAVGSPPYRSSMPSTPPYSPRADAHYGNGSMGRQFTMQERGAADEAAVLGSLQQPAGYAPGPSYWNSQPLTDGEASHCKQSNTAQSVV